MRKRHLGIFGLKYIFILVGNVQYYIVILVGNVQCYENIFFLFQLALKLAHQWLG